MAFLKLPVLPIPNVVFFPHTSLPIVVEEPNYITMVNYCIERDIPLALSLARPVASFRPGTNLITKIQYHPSQISGFGRPVILENQGAIGPIKMLIKGLGRARLGQVLQNLPFPIVEANSFSDKPESSLIQGSAISRITSLLDLWLEATLTDSLEREMFKSGLTSIHHIVDYACTILVHDRDIRQVLLECDSLIERINLLNGILQDRKLGIDNPVCALAIKNFEFIERLVVNSH